MTRFRMDARSGERAYSIYDQSMLIAIAVDATAAVMLVGKLNGDQEAPDCCKCEAIFSADELFTE